MNFSNLLPISACVAVVLFIARETLEHNRRRRGESRKLGAIKRILARECELNAYTLKSLTQDYKQIQSEIDEPLGFTFHVEAVPNGSHRFIRLDPDGEDSASSPIPVVSRDSLAKFLMDIAIADEEFLQVAEGAYDALAEVNHVRNYLLELERQSKDSSPMWDGPGLAEFAIEELATSQKALEALYVFCTGKPLTTFRLR